MIEVTTFKTNFDNNLNLKIINLSVVGLFWNWNIPRGDEFVGHKKPYKGPIKGPKNKQKWISLEVSIHPLPFLRGELNEPTLSL